MIYLEAIRVGPKEKEQGYEAKDAQLRNQKSEIDIDLNTWMSWLRTSSFIYKVDWSLWSIKDIMKSILILYHIAKKG